MNFLTYILYLEHTLICGFTTNKNEVEVVNRVLCQICTRKMNLDTTPPWREEIFQTNLHTLQKNTLPWWYVFVIVGRVFCHACTSMTILWQNQYSHTCAVVEVFHDITKIIITEVSTSMKINRASQKCFPQGWPTRGSHHNGTPLSYRVRFWMW